MMIKQSLSLPQTELERISVHKMMKVSTKLISCKLIVD